MTEPLLVSVGAFTQATTGAATFVNPAHQVNDLLVLAVESSATAGVSLSSAAISAGWQELSVSPRAQGSNVLALSVFWIRATTTSTANPQTLASSNHQVGAVAVIRSASTDANPFSSAVSNSNNSTTFNVPLDAVAHTEAFIFLLAASSTDATANQYGTFANSSLSSVTQVAQGGTTNGNGGSLNFVTARRPTAGSGGTFTATQIASAPWAGISLTVKPYVAPVIPSVGTFKVMVGGVKKTATPYVIIGGVKKTVTASTVVQAGSKKPVP